ncbi:hypothetical protein ACVMHZ_009651 [Bradyrhizobium liaoningense]|uniref:hypothetical protein n=1 Tax=Bradyrhizobium liaoningense TaxID=43992 RepID=UPI00235C849A|nr:hypothetical protein [Bradyrhizobium liaoningense]GLR99708.1 hypothetical protein GCM10007858_73560 [Bradyrhizobium liaoningense]
MLHAACHARTAELLAVQEQQGNVEEKLGRIWVDEVREPVNAGVRSNQFSEVHPQRLTVEISQPASIYPVKGALQRIRI